MSANPCQGESLFKKKKKKTAKRRGGYRERERAKSEGVSNRNPHSLLMILKNGTARRTVWLFLTKLNIALLGIYSKELKTYVNPKKKPYLDGCCCC